MSLSAADKKPSPMMILPVHKVTPCKRPSPYASLFERRNW